VPRPLRLAVAGHLRQVPQQAFVTAHVQLAEVRAGQAGQRPGVERRGQRRQPAWRQLPDPVRLRPPVMHEMRRAAGPPVPGGQPGLREPARRVSRPGAGLRVGERLHRCQPRPERLKVIGRQLAQHLRQRPRRRVRNRLRFRQHAQPLVAAHPLQPLRALDRVPPDELHPGPGPATPPTRTWPAPAAPRPSPRRTAAPGPRPPPPASGAPPSARCTSRSPPRSQGGPSVQNSDQPPASDTTADPESPARNITPDQSIFKSTLSLTLPRTPRASRAGPVPSPARCDQGVGPGRTAPARGPGESCARPVPSRALRQPHLPRHPHPAAPPARPSPPGINPFGAVPSSIPAGSDAHSVTTASAAASNDIALAAPASCPATV